MEQTNKEEEETGWRHKRREYGGKRKRRKEGDSWQMTHVYSGGKRAGGGEELEKGERA